MRGTLAPESSGDQDRRFIPAGAGNSIQYQLVTNNVSVHPRGCGELSYANLILSLKNGSSPRVRGTRKYFTKKDLDQRFIPAGAGNSLSTQSHKLFGAVHPRGCGELIITAQQKALINGSSPRVRGTPNNINPIINDNRFIPAGAGNSFDVIFNKTAIAVHPRGCGELCNNARLACRAGGSSPRVRGTLITTRNIVVVARFIPAGAGNSYAYEGRKQCRPVHPRGCGELSCDSGICLFINGSSPRVRGTHTRD